MHRKPTPARSPAAFAFLVDALRPLAGQRIALIAPAGGVRDDRIATAMAIMRGADIEVVLGAHARDHHRYLAGPTEARLADLHSAFEQAGVAAVWCLRGGYGSAHLVEHIDWSRIPDDIPLIGHSDISVLLEAWRQHGRPAIHGPTASDLATTGDTDKQRHQRVASVAALVDSLQGQGAAWPLAHIAGPSGPLSGQLVGGNLTTLASLAGTSGALTLDAPSILLLEDVGEAEFRLERSLHQLLGSIDVSQLSAVCLGTFERCSLADDMRSLSAIIGEWLAPLDVPLYRGAPMGHGFANHAWRLGEQAQLADNRLSADPGWADAAFNPDHG